MKGREIRGHMLIYGLCRQDLSFMVQSWPSLVLYYKDVENVNTACAGVCLSLMKRCQGYSHTPISSSSCSDLFSSHTHKVDVTGLKKQRFIILSGFKFPVCFTAEECSAATPNSDVTVHGLIPEYTPTSLQQGDLKLLLICSSRETQCSISSIGDFKG